MLLFDHRSGGADASDNDWYKLATALLSIASEDSRDVEVLKKAALQQMALDYRETTPTYYELKRRLPTYPKNRSLAHYRLLLSASLLFSRSAAIRASRS